MTVTVLSRVGSVDTRSFYGSHAENWSACDARAAMGFGSINLGYKKILVRSSIVASNSGQLIVQK